MIGVCRNLRRIAIKGIRRDLSLGPLATRSLADARQEAMKIRKLVADGRDPVTERRTQALGPSTPFAAPAIDNRLTVDACWRSFWATKKPQLSNGKHCDQGSKNGG